MYVYMRLLGSATNVTLSPLSKITILAWAAVSLRAPHLPIPGHYRRHKANNPSSKPFPSHHSDGRSPPDPQRPELDRACSGTTWYLFPRMRDIPPTAVQPPHELSFTNNEGISDATRPASIKIP
jgi:hypothetical protein